MNETSVSQKHRERGKSWYGAGCIVTFLLYVLVLFGIGGLYFLILMAPIAATGWDASDTFEQQQNLTNLRNLAVVLTICFILLGGFLLFRWVTPPKDSQDERK